ncbi:formate dehydrogenase accessory protein FdhD [Neoasaia chiangmaiensis NBRC 101099]|uniref:Sulfur carrier protein FdhD n=1 Tax=Neoasaia chiangmaiensis TaxID=320497 RepID=A0A1U9KPW0_9PROT|nr:formate dehydrogenase accessory sulfurtransferase FdhD [Neoasaia chiangmaiensis]AQS87740.1 hypothetical protein A0U93_07115 [Neoasaia chiangmaiensis]GBR41695.1 formate dehydrogenase accessory protein FdhD [Neoasaia chiangmaiensis NBRC 101099]GEN14336.1 sulfurtransferase FdhD [Neoasaia chiangmaiensis]
MNPDVALRVPGLRVGRDAEPVSRMVAEETPISLVFNELHPYAVMMATPADLEDFARGFALTERIVSRPQNVRDTRVQSVADGLELHVQIDGQDFSRLLQRGRRAITGRTGCGICGIDRIETLDHPRTILPAGQPIAIAAIRRALGNLGDHQPLNAETRMVHAAAWADPQGDIILTREDVGRHNALDKLIGAGIASSLDFTDGFCLLTSRYSFEMAEKTAIAGMRIVAAVSAPTARALRVAESAGQTVLAIARSDNQTVFCGAERILFQ